MTDFEKIQKINKLAKALKDSGMAKTSDDAAKIAEEMYEKSEKNIKEMKAEDISAQELIEGEYKTKPEYQKKVEIKENIKELKEDIKEVSEEEKKRKKKNVEEEIEKLEEEIEEESEKEEE